MEDILADKGAPSASFKEIGRSYKGTVVNGEWGQQRDYMTGDPKFWDDGNPMKQYVVTIQTDERDPAIEDDDGLRRLFLKGRKAPESKSSYAAVIAALGKHKLEVGGTLALKYVGGEGVAGDPKRYAAKYEPPVAQPDGLDEEEPF